jgi:hypothetical protein
MSANVLPSEYTDNYERTSAEKWIRACMVIAERIILYPFIVPTPSSVTGSSVYFSITDRRDYDAQPDETGAYPLIFSSVEHLRALRRCFPGVVWEKIATDWSYGYRGTFDGLTVQMTTSRESACTKVETGETEEYETVEYGPTTKVIKTRPVTRWVCPE